MTAGAPLREQALAFGCGGEPLVGIVSSPAGGAVSELALVVVVGGPQVRCGSHRQFTTLCRAAAAAGVTALRFDVRGMGDSGGALRSFEQLGEDIGAAIDALQRQCPGVRRVALWGLCDGASASLLYLHHRPDPRVAGLVLLNPWVRSAETLARAHVKHYYWNRLRQPEFWRKLLGGGVALKALRELLANLRTARSSAAPAKAGAAEALPFQARMLRASEAFSGRQLLVLSGQDYTAKEFVEAVAHEPRWQAVLARPGSTRLDLPEADHTFSARDDEAAVAAATLQWLAQAAHEGAPR